MSTSAELPLATVHGLYHIAIKTEDLAATRKFYTDIIGLRDFQRPDFGYPGAWLGCTQPGGLAILHVYAGGPALGPEGKAPAGTAAIDHVSLRARAIAPTFRGSRRPDSTGANSSCPARRCGSCSSMTRVVFSWN
jgi:catechol 2,3-dioxygenase-like lactoylglutathione lyase family enzyme